MSIKISNFYEGESISLLTKHRKEKVIGPLFSKTLKADLITIDSYDPHQPPRQRSRGVACSSNPWRACSGGGGRDDGGQSAAAQAAQPHVPVHGAGATRLLRRVQE